jgi:hypothetical protein
MATTQAPGPLRILVYSDDRTVRRAVITALGTRPDPELPELEFVEVATAPVVQRTADGWRISAIRNMLPAAPAR